MHNHLVSIIIPTYNRAHLISETLDSVLAQTYTDWECIVVDDGSTDTTEEVVMDYVAKDTRFQFNIRPKNAIKGASSSRNYGLSLCKGSYVLFLDSDDWLLPHCISQRTSFMFENPDLSFMVVPMNTKGNDNVVRVKNIPLCDDYLREFLSYRLYWGIMCTFWKKNSLVELGGFNEHYPRLNDPEIHIRGMLHFKDSYFIANNFPADSIYRMEEQKKGKKFSIKYIASLTLFLRDIVKELNDNNYQNYRTYLKYYLVDYLKNFSYCIPIKENLKLLTLAKKKEIINVKEYLLIMFWSVIRVVHFKITNYLNSKLNVSIYTIIKLSK
ncbi:hypothetical protein FLJC2902T_29760 [Flavobacterium limnosediminis JC2902]|uniref:Glycosyltransferase 2-like domain-containing protein n=1 Tax=Flavobacterium limnosediminis JC2902 TaxID=1341181 RepID=V6SHN1_9FLAO|nr:glycosyltransferase family 2 protein [Flavobacterium limnosediminis]ESU25964.1 hypothetical protein FLJC2902T_29760 [Flavobacterium limnosediminis JC2902]